MSTERKITNIRKKHFPIKTTEGFTVRVSTKNEVEAFLKKAFASVFSPQDGSLRFTAKGKRRAQNNALRKRYEALHHEWFLFVDPKGTPVGWHIGEAEDWATFYMRNTGILPEHQDKGIYDAFFDAFMNYLSELGYERVSSQHKATNRRILIMKLKRGFDIAGLELTENWGPLVKRVRLLAPERRLSFYRQYGEMEHYRAALPSNHSLLRTAPHSRGRKLSGRRV
jgi:GNAT superfamily N-acetyltransferase